MKRPRFAAVIMAASAMMAITLIWQSACGDRTYSGPPGIDSGSSTSASVPAENSPMVSAILPRVSKIRGLEADVGINATLISREELKLLLEEEAADEVADGEIEDTEKILRRLGLIEADDDLLADMLALLSGDIVGFYDQETAELKVVDEASQSASEELTLAHEITHALQDQNYTLMVLLPVEGSGNDDLDLARLALVEGDASMVEQEYFTDYLDEDRQMDVIRESEAMTPPAAVPPYLEATLYFPYDAGFDFVTYLKEMGGWQAVDDAYARPPESTEQIIHPEKYVAGEQPVDVRIPDLKEVGGDAWRQLDDVVLGEFDISQFMPGISERTSRRAAEGWGGSRLKFYEDASGRQVLVMLTAWDSISDAREFEEAYSENLAARYGSPAPIDRGEVFTVTDGAWVVKQRQEQVAVVFAPGADWAFEMSERLLED